MASRPATLIELLDARQHSPGGYIAVDTNNAIREFSFHELCEASRTGAAAVAQINQSLPYADHPCAILSIADPIAFITAFFSVMRAGITPIPAPSAAESHPAQRRRLLSLLADSGSHLLIADKGRINGIKEFLDATPPLLVPFDELQHTSPELPVSIRPAIPDDHAYVQYTSGSTSDPKPAKLTHRNVMAELKIAATAYEETKDSIAVHWVPLYHGMGLVCAILRPLYSGYKSVVIDSLDFARRPALWPEQLTRWAATITSAPAFGYTLCANKTTDVSGINLSTLRVARVSSEMVTLNALNGFERTFKDAFFRPSAFCPSYGLVEATLAVTSCPAAIEPKVVSISRSGLRAGTVKDPANDADTIRLVSSGPPLPYSHVLILDEFCRPVKEEGIVGEIWVSGPQVIPRAGDTIADMNGRRTGDMGFVLDGDLIPTGRHSELFQIRGVNYYSGEIESLVTTTDTAFEPGRVAAFLANDSDLDPRLIVIAELAANTVASRAAEQELRTKVIRAVSRDFGIRVNDVRFVSPDSLPLTSSGKLRRGACRSLYESGGLSSVGCL